MVKWFKSKQPEPIGPTRKIYKFSSIDKPITQDGVSYEENGWLVESNGDRTVLLFEIKEPSVDQCMLTYRANMKSEDVKGKVYLEMWCQFPGRGEFFSKGFHQALKGTNNWGSYEVQFYLKEGQRPDMVKLNVTFKGQGKVWMKDIELLQTPLSNR